MKLLTYVIKTMIRGKSSNIIKIVSLTIGLGISIIIFAREAWEFNYDTNYKDYKELFMVKSLWKFDNDIRKGYSTIGPMAKAIGENFSDKVESVAATLQWWDEGAFYKDNQRHIARAIVADSAFFKTLSQDIVEGNPNELKNPNTAFVSEQLVRSLFAGQNPIGRTINLEKKTQFTIKGIYEDFPENSQFYDTDIIMSFATAIKYSWEYFGWNGGGNYIEYVRLKDRKDSKYINNRLEEMINKYRKNDANLTINAELIPIEKYRFDSSTDKMQMSISLMILAATILFVVTLNYVLISISSLSRRAKAIGVHKCSGAGRCTIVKMFLYETAIIICTSLILLIIILFNFKDNIEDSLQVSFSTLFNIENLWASVCVILFLFIVGGIIPGMIFSNIPVTQVFTRYKEGKKEWKLPLLFIQFVGIAFIFGLLVVVVKQSNFIVNKERGYNYERLAYTNCNFHNPENAINTIRNLPYVTDITTSSQLFSDGLMGDGVITDDGKWISMRHIYGDKNLFSFYKMKYVSGHNFSNENEIVINETFAKLMHWKNPIGMVARGYNGGIWGTVVGVLKEFNTGNPASTVKEGLFITHKLIPGGDNLHKIQIKLKEPFNENFKKLNEDMEKMFPTYDVQFKPFQKVLDYQNVGAIKFKEALYLATIAILFITIMGLIGYVSDEIQRRSKEIAIRKVNGANSMSILSLLGKGVLWICLPAVLLGTIISWYFGEIWLNTYVECVTFSPLNYILTAIAALTLIIGCVLFESWKIANENPITSLKAE